MDRRFIDDETPRSSNFGTPRDDRFFTPRASFSRSSSEEWVTPRGALVERKGSDPEFLTPRGNFDTTDRSYKTGYTDPQSRESSSSYADNEENDDTVAAAIMKGTTSEADIEDIFSYTRHGRGNDVERLLDKGIPINIRDTNGNTILIIACQNGNKRLAKIALRRGGNINVQNYKGNTPLHYCYHYGYGDLLGQYLISKGADPYLRNKAGHLCFDGI